MWITFSLMDKKEYILCSAIHYRDGKEHPSQPVNIETGYVICGLRHHNIINTLGHVFDKYTDGDTDDEQGFLTNLGRFVNRVEGLEIAVNAGQVVKGKEVTKGRLHSEDLYQ